MKEKNYDNYMLLDDWWYFSIENIRDRSFFVGTVDFVRSVLHFSPVYYIRWGVFEQLSRGSKGMRLKFIRQWPLCNVSSPCPQFVRVRRQRSGTHTHTCWHFKPAGTANSLSIYSFSPPSSVAIRVHASWEHARLMVARRMRPSRRFVRRGVRQIVVAKRWPGLASRPHPQMWP